ncbi:MAG: hypothetical protein M3Q97_05805 [Bacteroidota bacterium]|nr:hypothetical protein [Bacteroidota bacterium]
MIDITGKNNFHIFHNAINYAPGASISLSLALRDNTGNSFVAMTSESTGGGTNNEGEFLVHTSQLPRQFHIKASYQGSEVYDALIQPGSAIKIPIWKKTKGEVSYITGLKLLDLENEQWVAVYVELDFPTSGGQIQSY